MDMGIRTWARLGWSACLHGPLMPGEYAGQHGIGSATSSAC
eukprot:CAMPEP_0183507214 /NCGR_PEP_ID=MMETSP0371-20130417/8053_1 /TAXON_ID=268820 /ORGANISM="Peridinium aciculiferum, Strain PAER-2" /LENGTH=40 /DNA_ID= /DNA_START= /DNA_END= /DNA_ORIENTATION=